MFTNHLKQFVNLKRSEFPKVYTNYENIVGKNSTSYKRIKHDYVVIDKISKFTDGVNDDHLYLLFVYDSEKDKYDVFDKKNVENLTERYGFKYNTENMDNRKIGDSINKGEVLYKSTSYDDNMNYCYGINAKFVYLLHNSTIEDAVACSESISRTMVSTEIESVKVSINDNDILCNIYGDINNYKVFPDINEKIKNKILCAKRRIHNDQVLFDLKKSNLRKINYSSDTLSLIEGKIIDINIYCNRPLNEIDENDFNKQILKYHKMHLNYYERVYKTCKKIMDSGSKYSRDISFYMKKAKNILDDKYKWREGDNSVFSNMVIEFLVERDSYLSVGQKITGRYGNKGVISEIVPDSEMPFLETGERIDFIFNVLGIINRLASFQMYECTITYICNRTVEKLKSMTTMDDKEDLLINIISYFNEDQSKELRKYLDTLDNEGKEIFFDNLDDTGIFIHIPPLWENGATLFDRIRTLYNDHRWIQQYDVFVYRFDRKVKLMKKLVVGDMYIIKLMQTAKKGFSARSTGSLSRKGLPEKSTRAKTHQELYPKTPIRIGIDENLNANIGVTNDLVAQVHLFYRSSVIGRKHLGKMLLTRLSMLDKFKYNRDFKNRNVEILQAFFKSMGLKIEFDEEIYTIPINTGFIQDRLYDDMLIISTSNEFKEIKRRMDVIKNYKKKMMFIGTEERFNEIIDEEVEKQKIAEENYVIKINI